MVTASILYGSIDSAPKTVVGGNSSHRNSCEDVSGKGGVTVSIVAVDVGSAAERFSARG